MATELILNIIHQLT